jgi:hypothetical protein
LPVRVLLPFLAGDRTTYITFTLSNANAARSVRDLLSPLFPRLLENTRAGFQMQALGKENPHNRYPFFLFDLQVIEK